MVIRSNINVKLVSPKFLKIMYVLNFIMFCSCNIDLFQVKNHVLLVTVEPEGFPAKPHVRERQLIIFNIGVCLVSIYLCI